MLLHYLGALSWTCDSASNHHCYVPNVRLGVCLKVIRLPISISISYLYLLCPYLSIYLSIYLSVCLSIYLSIYLYIYI